MQKIVDLIGKKFGRLTVIERSEDYVSSNNRRYIRWLCQCDCNGEDSLKIIVYDELRRGSIQSCGCLRRELASKRFKKYNTYDLTGEYGIGYTSKGEEFYFDLEDYDKIKNYSWHKANGYILSSLNRNTKIWMHRLITDCPDDMEVDHEFHKTWDNRKKFLRIVTSSQNTMNQSLRSDNSSGVTGVSWSKDQNDWKACIYVNGKHIHLGSFNNFDGAVQVRKEAEIKYFGEFRYKEELSI